MSNRKRIGRVKATRRRRPSGPIRSLRSNTSRCLKLWRRHKSPDRLRAVFIDPVTTTAARIKHELVRDMLRLFGEARLRVVGASMLPALWPGDVVTIQPRRFEDILAGQIVTFAPGGAMISHRVVSRIPETGCLITRGDRCLENDSPVHGSQVLGVIHRIQRGGSSVSIRPRGTPGGRAAGWLLRHSDVATRVAVCLHGLWRTVAGREVMCKV